MALNLFRSVLFFLLVSIVTASDPDITKDYIFPKNFTAIDRNFFTDAGPRGIWDGDYPPNFKVTKASMTKFPALNGQTVSFAGLEFPVGVDGSLLRRTDARF